MLKQYWINETLWEWDTERCKWTNLVTNDKVKTMKEWEEAFRAKNPSNPDQKAVKELGMLFADAIKLNRSNAPHTTAKTILGVCMSILESLGYHDWYENLLINSPNLAHRVSDKALEAGSHWGKVAAWYFWVLEMMEK